MNQPCSLDYLSHTFIKLKVNPGNEVEVYGRKIYTGRLNLHGFFEASELNEN